MTPKNLLFVALVFAVGFTACKENKETPTGKPLKKSLSTEQGLSQPLTSITGSWAGDFERDVPETIVTKETGESYIVSSGNKITLVITRLSAGNISGYSVCAGNERPFSGGYEEEGNNIKAVLQEPGDDKYDGVFELTISKEAHTLTGKWSPFNKSLGGRHYNLQRKNFTYNSTLGDYPEASMRLLREEDVNNLIKEELRFMRNEIYARHGYSFKVKDVRQHFEMADWYMPVSTDVRKKLSPVEVKNEKLIKNFEKYAEESYDDFGR